jgi:polysaccharide biosynthesis protein PslH
MQRRLRVLWLSHFVPFPPKGGCFQRSFNLLAGAAQHHEVHLLALRAKPPEHPEAADDHARRALLEHCASVDIVDLSSWRRSTNLVKLAAQALLLRQPVTVTLYRSAAVHEMITDRLESAPFDLVHFDSISLAEYFASTAGVPTVMTHHGAEAHMMRRRIANEPSLLRKFFFALEWRALDRVERTVCPETGCNVVVSTLDRDILAQTSGAAKYVVVENGVDVDYFQPLPIIDSPTLIFAGRLDQYANRDAILHFLDTTWPLVLAQHPQATIRLIGSNPPPRLQQLAAADARIRLLGYVDDVRPHFADCAVAICPIRDGGGTRIKILDAMAQAKPLVSTTIGCEGLDVVPERDLLIADDPVAFASQIDRLFTTPDLRARLGANGRTLVESRYAWSIVVEHLLDVYDAAAASSRRTSCPA